LSRPPVLSCASEREASAALREAAAVLARGGIVAHPTETLYGLAADPWNESALRRLVGLKGRDAGKGLILIAADRAQVRGLVAAGTPPLWERLASRFWPGPLTMILPAGESTPAGVLGPGGGVAIRISSDALATRLVAAAGRPLTSTSANLGGRPPATSAAGVVAALGDGVDLVLDGGPREASEPSTLVDLLGPAPRVLREGPIKTGLIEAAAREG